MKKIVKKVNSKASLPFIAIGAVLVDQAVASLRPSVENHFLDLSQASAALDHISADQSAASGSGISDQLAALNALVQTELALVSGALDDLSIGSIDGLSLFAGENASSETLSLEGASEEGMGNPILLAQADASRETLTDQPNPVLAQLSQGTTQQSNQASSASKPAEKAVSTGDSEGFNWPLIGGALAGLALLSGDGDLAPTNAPTEAPTFTPTSAPLDKISPTASISIADKTLTSGEQTTITITFSELVKNFELSDLSSPNGVVSDLVQSTSNPLIWTAKFVPSVSTEDLTNVVALIGEYADLAGNAGATASSENFIVATKLDGGAVADGYIDGATVFRDLNGDGILGDGEDSVLTGPGGIFSGLGGYGGTIVAFGGTDISTGLAFAGVLKAPGGSAVINPLTTLVEAVMGDTSGKSPSEIASMISSAEAKVANLLGIDPSLSITQIDPIALIAAGGPGAAAALKMQLAAIQVANVLVTLTQSIINSGVSTDAAAASLLMSDALASLINNASADGLDLGNASVINGLFASVVSAASESGSVSAASLASLQSVAAQASNALAAVNAKIDAIDLNSGIQGLTNAVAAQLVIVGESGLLNALSSGQEFSTDNLDQLINDNLDDVKDVVAPTTAPTTAPTIAPTEAPTSGPDEPDGIWDISNPDDPDQQNIDFDVTDTGTVNLNTSLSALSAMGIDSVVAATGSGVNSVNVMGYGSATEVTGLLFAEDLDVNLQLTAADDALVSTDGVGTVTLNTSLSALSAMGIDTITGFSGTSVVIQGGIGQMSLSEIMDLGLNFADGGDDGSDLFVNLDMTDAGSSVLLDTGDAVILRDMGIDFINGDEVEDYIFM